MLQVGFIWCTPPQRCRMCLLCSPPDLAGYPRAKHSHLVARRQKKGKKKIFLDCDLIFKLHNRLFGEKIIPAKPRKSRSWWINLFSIFPQSDLGSVVYFFFQPNSEDKPLPTAIFIQPIQAAIAMNRLLWILNDLFVSSIDPRHRWHCRVWAGRFPADLSGRIPEDPTLPDTWHPSHQDAGAAIPAQEDSGRSKWQCDSPKKKIKNKERWPWTAGCQPIKPSTINKPGFILLLKILISTEGEVKKWFTPKFSFPTASPRVVFQTSHTSSGYGGILPGMGDQDFGDRAGNKGVPHQKGQACWCQTLPGCGTSRGGRCCRTAGRACRDKSRGSQQHSHWKQGKKVNLVDFSSPSAIM